MVSNIAFLYFRSFVAIIFGDLTSALTQSHLCQLSTGLLCNNTSFEYLKYRLQFGMSVEIKLDTVFETLFAECLHRPRLAYLTGTFQQDWLPVRNRFPRLN